MKLLNEGWAVFGAYENNGTIRPNHLSLCFEDDIIRALFNRSHVYKRLIAVKGNKLIIIKYNMSADEFLMVFSRDSELLKSEIEKVVSKEIDSVFTKKFIKEIESKILK